MVPGQLVGSEIHGFHTLQDLDFGNIVNQAGRRWLRPHEIHAILCNYKHFSVNSNPVNLPKSGTIVLYDRKMLRNFRKDGHNWKKKKGGKINESHERLKVGNEERIHVYYVHGQDNPTFARRCYWLLDKNLEHIVLVHYREVQEESGAIHVYYAGDKDFLGPGDNLTVQNHELRLHEINTLEWEELILTNDSNNSTAPKEDEVSSFDQSNQIEGMIQDSAEAFSFSNLMKPISRSDNIHSSFPDSINVQAVRGQVNTNIPRNDSITIGTSDSLYIRVNDGLQREDSFGSLVNIMTELPCSMDDATLASGHESFVPFVVDDHQSSTPEHIFRITNVSLASVSSTEKMEILVTGFFHEEYLHLAKCSLFCVCGDVCVRAETVQVGVYRCLVLPHSPGLVNLFMSFDGLKAISQVWKFEYHTLLSSDPVVSSEEKYRWEELRAQHRLADLLFSTSKNLNILSNKVSPKALEEAKRFDLETTNISNSWACFIKSIEDNKTPFLQAKDILLELTLKNRLKEWLLERVVSGSKTNEYDVQGQAVIHLCAILGYTWAVYLFSRSGISLDFRDKCGWTALHWAAYCGREKMVAVLLSAGAKPNFITDPTSEHPGGCTAADLASSKGYDGLAAYLSEKALVEQFKDMNVARIVSSSLETSSYDTANSENLSEDQLCLKDTLAACRTVAEAAARIQAAFREHIQKLRAKEVRFSIPEAEPRSIVAAMKIQHAFQNYESRKRIKAAARIQHRFRTWKIRKQFLNLRHRAIKIQAAFRRFQVRKQYLKILWSTGILEKAILRWRLKRRGFRGLRGNPVEADPDQRQEGDTVEDFYRASQKQAEEHIQRSVEQVQAMILSKTAQQEYRRMKMTHDQARLEYEGLREPDN
ncbi:calmodulin-binding transcription activator 5-like isoform X2 [Corylus avellana]|uniref:calmodulin-binding transcription activator 5-like isoform X2 n=1 Tax=Corylus avellana TaxID=13451 RepID=UPI00286C3992|nr:calmodulin-binding transcription activator 5-like isoform X2 [Corylus avellana]